MMTLIRRTLGRLRLFAGAFFGVAFFFAAGFFFATVFAGAVLLPDDFDVA